mmetsp:Transcript_11591/g.13746  ORF Transcript_11591/g.13746 Transcript_11591/m.13746 type:complete len:161 (+) Transcript_11591:228-710(+)|eukprot:CAMPEP_0197859780 /NCGR_PEP_ID=MMETSP1438-20131217/34659_1 /TAXON_ID=1461541 /ORGANISM="Pterosperma sp., Strain CCMP1384" /LENGTH=160 /DNA_ID=CAMNT_0043476419 /DNA_START=224 /DNA_END=706 /DNA_ORIENTATION=-
MPPRKSVLNKNKQPTPSNHAINCPSRSRIHGYIAQHHLEKLFEDLTAFLVFHKPPKPYKFLVAHMDKIVQGLRDGKAAEGLLKQFDPVLTHTDDGKTPIMEGMPALPIGENPDHYEEYLEDNKLRIVLEEAFRGLTVALPGDPYQALIEFFQEQSMVHEQ